MSYVLLVLVLVLFLMSLAIGTLCIHIGLGVGDVWRLTGVCGESGCGGRVGMIHKSSRKNVYTKLHKNLYIET